ncbi:MAG: hypothetical protein K8L97_19055 [Anaerolineae bacterium]|nr:hypothetical protein [Anaerolineae bacterium]
MSRRYAPDHKQLVLKIFNDYKGNVIHTVRYTGVPERTLRDWVEEARAAAARRKAAAQRQK